MDSPIKRQLIPAVKSDLLSADGSSCPLCSVEMRLSENRKTPLNDNEATPDHLLDLVIGGNNSRDNVLIICHSCNTAKNFTLQKQFSVPTIGGPGQSGWREEFRIREKNILKLLKYVEWSFKLGEEKYVGDFPDLESDFAGFRFGIHPITTVTETESHTFTEPPLQRLQDLEDRVTNIEDTIWMKISRIVRRLFRSKSLKRNEAKLQELDEPIGPKLLTAESNSLPQKMKTPDNSREENEFTPEQFSRILIEQLNGEEETLANAYNVFVKKNPDYKLQGIGPKKYISEYCQDWLSIREQPDKSGKVYHAWIREKSIEIEMKTELDPDKILERTRRKAEAKSKKEIQDIREQFANTNTHAIDENMINDSPEPVEFRELIFDIFSEAETNRLSISALGLRLSKKVQMLGFDNTKGYFKTVFGEEMTVTLGLRRYFSEDELKFVGDLVFSNGEYIEKYTHVILDRRN